MILRCSKCLGNATFRTWEENNVKRLECICCNNKTEWFQITEEVNTLIADSWNQNNPI